MSCAAKLFEAVLCSSEMGITITTTSNHYEQISGRVPIEHADQAIGAVLAYNYSPTQRFYLLLRRLFDIGASLVGCLALALVIPLVWLGNKLLALARCSTARSASAGAAGPLWCGKFRSMIVDAEKHTGGVGRRERPAHYAGGPAAAQNPLDEIPQFWNILKGDL